MLNTLIRAALSPEPPSVDAGLAALAEAHGLAPLLGSRPLRGPDEVRAHLVRAHRACAAAQLVVERALAGWLAACRAVGLPVVALKGLALARSVYRLGQRSMRDVDVLTSDPRAAALLRHAGARVLARGGHETAFVLPGPPAVAVDLHRSLAAPPLFGVDGAALAARAAAQPDGLLVPAPADLLVSLAIHAALDGFHLPLRALVDGLLLEGASPAAVLARALDWRARRATARWLAILVDHGLAGEWPAAARSLAARRDPAPVFYPSPDGPDAAPWRARLAFARSVDQPTRALAYFASSFF